MRTMQLAISFLVIFAILADLTCAHQDKEEDDVSENDFSYCLEYCGCKEDGGLNKIKNCFNMLGEADNKFAMDYFREEYEIPDATLDVLDAEGCKDPERAKKTFDEYYNARKEHEKEKGFTPDDEEKLQKCRNCFLAMVQECAAMRKMGMIG